MFNVFLQNPDPIAVSMSSVRRSARQSSLENYGFAVETVSKAPSHSARYVQFMNMKGLNADSHACILNP